MTNYAARAEERLRQALDHLPVGSAGFVQLVRLDTTMRPTGYRHGKVVLSLIRNHDSVVSAKGQWHAAG